MTDYRIYEQLKRGARRHVSFHTPGHKGGGALAGIIPVCRIDATELSYTDDLGNPTGVIAAAQADIAMIAGAKRAYITTDGSSSGVLAMLYAASARGGKIIVPRNSHKSVWNACRLFGLEPVIVQGEEKDGVLLPPPPEIVAQLVQRDADICGMIVTSPDYYGNIAPLQAYTEALHAAGRLLIADGAHGAHLAFERGREGYGGAFADMWVDGAHKSLPSLTQGAAVFLNDESLRDGLEEGLSIFRTTSPSFPVMASVEFGYKYLAENPQLTERAKGLAASFKEQNGGLTFYPSADWTKLCIDFAPLGINPSLAAAVLEKRGIYAEFADGRYLVFYLSAMTAPRHLKALSRALARIVGQRSLRGTYAARRAYPVNGGTYSYLYALGQPFEYVPLKESAGRMCACNAGLTPPCIPVVAAGEVISDSAIKLLQEGEHTFGLNGGNIKVVKTYERQIHNF